MAHASLDRRSVRWWGERIAEIEHEVVGMPMVPPARLGYEVARVAASLKHREMPVQTEAIPRSRPLAAAQWAAIAALQLSQSRRPLIAQPRATPYL
jgi:hypothetical protein